ncbi:MAG: GWxTD domain-containing protein [Bacteroidales bacterium]|nr:GWxTD domain-containing protein [Bacteroidales bacterium]
MKKPALISLLFIVVIGSTFAKKLSKINLANLYNEQQFTRVDNLVFHTSETVSTIYLNINLHDLHYVKSNDDSRFAKFKIQYELYESWDSKSPIDTASLVFTSQQEFEGDMKMIYEFDINAAFPGNYLLKYMFTDVLKPENTFTDFIEINKSSKNTSQNFFITGEDDYPVFGYHLPAGANFNLLHNNPRVDTLYIRYYNRQFPLAKPPFATEKEETYTFEPDSIYIIVLQEGKSELLTLPYHGIYHFQTDISKPDGLSLFQFNDGFPDIDTPALALAPLRYLTTRNEFEKLTNYPDYKVAVDSFWLERSSKQPTRAKNMIKRYYSRVQDANKLFTSYHEGWKTDRGLLYIIYGPPSEVYRKGEEEEWIYGERRNPLSIRFYFYNVENPFTLNDYQLSRSSTYKTSWNIAIENWRR